MRQASNVRQVLPKTTGQLLRRISAFGQGRVRLLVGGGHRRPREDKVKGQAEEEEDKGHQQDNYGERCPSSGTSPVHEEDDPEEDHARPSAGVCRRSGKVSGTNAIYKTFLTLCHRHLIKIDRSYCPTCSAIFSPGLPDILLRLAT